MNLSPIQHTKATVCHHNFRPKSEHLSIFLITSPILAETEVVIEKFEFIPLDLSVNLSRVQNR